MKRTHFKQEDLQVTLVSSFVNINNELFLCFNFQQIRIVNAQSKP